MYFVAVFDFREYLSILFYFIFCSSKWLYQNIFCLYQNCHWLCFVKRTLSYGHFLLLLNNVIGKNLWKIKSHVLCFLLYRHRKRTEFMKLFALIVSKSLFTWKEEFYCFILFLHLLGFPNFGHQICLRNIRSVIR